MNIAGKSVISLLLGEWTMWILIAISVAAITLIVERFLYFKRNAFKTSVGFNRFRELMKSGNREETLRYTKSQNNPMGRVLTLLVNNMHLTADELSDLAYSAILEEKLLFERFLGGLGTIANVSTLAGLMGTVWGLIVAFNKIYTAAGSGGAKIVAGGIAVALLSTLVGLFVGILALICFNYFNKKASDLAAALDSMTERAVVLLHRLKAHPATETVKAEPRLAPKPELKEDDSIWQF